MSHLLAFAALAFAVGAVAFMASMAKISKVPRVWLARRRSKAGIWLFDLVSCPFCLSVWLSFAATAVYRPLLVTLWEPLDWLVTSLAMAAAAMLPVLLIKAAVTR